jgi:TPR repeat protein
VVPRAAAAGRTDSMINLGILLAEAGQVEEAERWFRRAFATGDPTAMPYLRDLLARRR